jgi:murein DD-endopeptidase MepM/ murein hydrolase activator NlpD
LGIARGAAARGRGGRVVSGLVTCAAFAAAVVVPSSALAQSSGTGGAAPTATPSPAPQAAPPPGLPPVRSRAKVARLVCASVCGAGGAVRPGALLRVRGKALRRTAEIDFAGAPGEADDIAAAPVKRRKTSVDVRVPLGAVTGPVTVVDADGVASAPAPVALVVDAPVPATPAVDGPSIDVDVQAPRAYFDAQKPMKVTYVVHDDRALDVRVELVRAKDAAVVASWTPGVVAPETPQVVQWNGLSGGRVQKAGRYAFRVSAADPAGAVLATSSAAQPDAPAGPAPSTFMFLRHQFPVRGPHGYGEYAARFGGGRGHQGQDVMAACGTPIVAARGGVVKVKQFQSAAGNYVVIDGEQTSVDYAYMHMAGPAIVAKGERVKTGQPIGIVGRTGRATACHLHFEEWTGPGWYKGGSPFDPLADLLAWDKRP